MPKLLFAFASAAFYLSSGAWSNAASLIGSQVTLTVDSPTLGSAVSIANTETVSSGVEFPAGSLIPLPGFSIIPVSIDVGASTINLAYAANQTATVATFNGYVFDFAGAPTITGATLDSSSTFTPSQVIVGFGPSDVTVNVEGLSVTTSSVILVDVTTSAPEPQSYALLPLGLAVLSIGLWTGKLFNSEISNGTLRRFVADRYSGILRR